MNNPLYDIYNKICEYCRILEEKNYDTYRTFQPLAESDIEKWEREHEAKLPEGYKNWLLLSNGFDMKITANIFPLEFVGKCSIPGYEEYFKVGAYIGDGSVLLIDDNGKFYECDHCFGLEEKSFETFLEDTVIFWLEDHLKEIGIHVESKSKPKKVFSEEDIKEMLAKLEEKRKNRKTNATS